MSTSEAQDKEGIAVTAVVSKQETHRNTAVNNPDFPPRVYFDALNADSFNIRVIYWYYPPDYWKYLGHGQWINQQIVERFEVDGISFAFPTQTLYLAGDEKRPLVVSSLAKAEDHLKPEEVSLSSAAINNQGSAR